MEAIDQSHCRRRPSSALGRCGSGNDQASAPPPALGASFRTSGFMQVLKPFLWAGRMGTSWRKTKTPKAGAEETRIEVFEMEAIDESHCRRRRNSALGRCGSGNDEASAPRPAHGASFRTSGFMQLLKPFLWAGRMGTSWRKTKTPNAGVEEEVLEAPAWKTISRRFENQVAIARASTAALGVGDILEPTVPTPRTKAEPSSDPIATFDAFPLRKLDARTRAGSLPALRRAKTAGKVGAGARLLDRVRELRAHDATNKTVASPTLVDPLLLLCLPRQVRSFSTYGIPVKKAEHVEEFALPQNMPAGKEAETSLGDVVDSMLNRTLRDPPSPS
ncbi:hypothetical protein T484DRAFT_1861633 [Baffinella frigidus]|nr:hypothetical protein T484DRAFT_1861633 [Cryptophyta sp. CCMP2293]